MREPKYHLTLDRYEHGVIINALNGLRNKQIKEHRPTDVIDELIIKTADAPIKNYRTIEKSCRCYEER
jgi:hypothetical protein